MKLSNIFSSNLSARIASSIAMFLLAYLLLFVVPQPYGLYIILLTIGVFASLEMDNMRADNFHILYVLALPFVLLFFDAILALKIYTISFVLLAIFAGQIGKFSNIKLGWLLAQMVYLFIPISVIYYYFAGNVKAMLPVVAIIVATDVFAFVFGKLFGRKFINKQFSKNSPNKTWEGYIGALVCSIIIGNLLLQGSFTGKILMACLISSFAVAGDIFASSMKRNFGVKDSGNIIPGHGGVLDRFDGFLGAFLGFGMLYFTLGFII